MKVALLIINKEKGSSLVIVLLILVLLTLIGRAVINTSSVDQQMAGQHRRHETVFYGADGGTEIACELLEQNIGCPIGFTDNTGGFGAVIEPDVLDGARPTYATYGSPPYPCPNQIGEMQGVMVNTLNFYQNPTAAPPANSASSDLFFPPNWAAACSHRSRTNLTVGEDTTVFAQGSAIQMVAGYEGKGKGAGGGGGQMYYTVFSQHIGASEDITIGIRWRHAIGQEGGCNY